jgi:hypothetical protein
MKPLERYHEKVAENISRHGRHLVGVFPNEGEPDPLNNAFQYTIGNHLKGLPELLLIGLYDNTFILNRLSSIMIERGRKFTDGELVSLGEGAKYSLLVVDAADSVKDRYTIQAGQHLGTEEYQVMQVVMPDKSGRFPGQRGASAPYSKVIVHRKN